MKKTQFISTLLASAFLINPLNAATFTVSVATDNSPYTIGDPGDLRRAINDANVAGGTNNIVVAINSVTNPVVTLEGILPLLNILPADTSLTIDGTNTGIGGGGTLSINGNTQQYPGFFARQGTVNLSNMTIIDTQALGGNGGHVFSNGNDYGAGGGGLGGGGALFIDAANVTISNINFTNNSAKGGNGSLDTRNLGGGGGGMFGGTGGVPGDDAGAGGGGLGGHGGSGNGNGGFAPLGAGGGGGGGGIAPGSSVNSSSNPPGAYGGNGYDRQGLLPATVGDDGGGWGIAGNSGLGGTGGQPGGLRAGGGGGGGASGLGNGEGGGGGGGISSFAGELDANGNDGGIGGYGGGGGGAGGTSGTTGGDGGFGGGGGGGGRNVSGGGDGGNGGFGGGGGGGVNNSGNGGFGGGGGGGNGTGGIGGGGFTVGSDTGGSGAGLGGAAFVNSSGGGTLTVAGLMTITGSSVTAGTAGKAGIAAADNIFFTSTMPSNPLTFNLAAPDTVTINGVIGDDSIVTIPAGQTYTQGTNGPWAGLDKKGAGLLVLNGANTYAGKTTVYQGELKLNSRVAGDMDVLSGGTVTGTGTVGYKPASTTYGGNLHIFAGGTIKPGNSIGTLHVLQNYTHDVGAFYVVQFNGVTSNLIDIRGAATLFGGQVLVDPLSYPPSTTPYTIVHADNGVTGFFNGITLLSPIPDYTAALLYDPNNVYLVFTKNGPPIDPIKSFASTCNQKSVAGILDITTSAALKAIVQILPTLPLADIQHALDQMSGEQYTTLLTMAELTGEQFVRRLYDPLRTLVTTYPCCNCWCCPTLGGWLEAGGGESFLDGSVNCHGLKMESYDVAGGVQTTCNCNLTLGAAATYAHDHIDYKIGGSGHNNTVLGAIYSLYRPQGYYILGDIAYGYSQDRVKRHLEIGDDSYRASSKPKIYQGIAYGEVGIDLCLPNCTCLLLQPYGGLEASIFRRSQITESGDDGINLELPSVLGPTSLHALDSTLQRQTSDAFPSA